MQSFGYSDLLTRFEIKPLKDLTFLTATAKIEGLFEEQPQQPENLSEYLWDPNDFYIEPKNDIKKKSSAPSNTDSKQILLIGKADDKKQTQNQEKKKNYRPGPFANFYQINEGTLDKDAEVWYYKEHKDIVGPVSSYNMDKMVFYHKVDDETRVAFKTVDKFVKLGKIKKIVEEEKVQHTE